MCPRCSSSISTTTTDDDAARFVIKPKYTRVIKGRRIVEVQFDDIEILKKWLKYVHLNINSDGLPTFVDDTTIMTKTVHNANMTSSHSLLHSGSLLANDRNSNSNDDDATMTECRAIIDNHRIPLKSADELMMQKCNSEQSKKLANTRSITRRNEQSTTMKSKTTTIGQRTRTHDGGDENAKVKSRSSKIEIRHTSIRSHDRHHRYSNDRQSSSRRRQSRDRSDVRDQRRHSHERARDEKKQQQSNDIRRRRRD